MKLLPWSQRTMALAILPALFIPSLSATGQTIPNPGFETDTFTSGVGYISQNVPITGWTESFATRVGQNPAGASSPFANNGTIPEGSNVAFLQASAGEVGTLTTTITGLTPGTTYVLSFYANARAYGDQTAGLQVSVGGIGLNLYDDAGGPFPALVPAGAYLAVHGMFTATATDHDLVVANNLLTGDHTLLVDDFKIAAVGGVTISNPGFETDTFTVFPGYISGNTPITGWTGDPDTRVGQNPSDGSPFANNGTIPEGSNVGFIQANAGVPSTLSTTVSGLTPGAKYKVSCRMNARSPNTPWLTFSTDGAGETVTASVTPVGGTNPYHYASFEFVATAASHVITLTNDAPSGDQTVVVDDFAIAPSSGAWGFAPWTGDQDSGISSQFFYTHAYSFGNSPPVTINGVRFIPREDGEAGRFTLSGLNSAYPNLANSLTGESTNLAKDFRYGGATGITLENLEPDTDYVFTLYGVGFDAGGPRSATFSSSVDGGADKFTVDLNQYGQGNGMLVTYAYTTDSSGSPVTISYPRTAAGTFHTSGFSNRKATPAAEPTAWTTAAWTDDASSGIDGSYLYTHAFNFGSAVSPNIDGVVFTGISGGNPAGTGLTTFLPTTYTNDLNNSIGGYSEPLTRDFAFVNSPTVGPELITLTGLTPGENYVFTIYSSGWEAPGGRFIWMFGNPGDGPVWVDQSQFGANQGILIEYQYTANSAGEAKIMTSSPATPTGNMHICAISNREADPLVDTAPVITLDPVGATVGVGADYLLRAEGTGSGPRTYQWKFGGLDISGANSSVLELFDIQPSDAGDYTLTITNEMASSATSAPATLVVIDNVPGVFATGVGVDGEPLAGGAIDPHFTLVTNPNDPLSSDVFVQSGVPGSWLGNSATSKWVGPLENASAADGVTDEGDGPGVYVYRTQVDLTNFDLGTVQITGGWATDNAGLDIRVNGASTGLTNTVQFGSLTPFTINTGNAPGLLAGVNTIDFVVENAGNGWTGLRVEGLQAIGSVPPGTAPYIAVQPAGTNGPHDDYAVFAVGASGSYQLSYQWYRNDVLMPGETGPVLEVLVSDYTDDGAVYKVDVINGSGNELSTGATLTVSNADPVPGEDAAATDQNVAIELNDFDLLANDTDPDGDILELAAVDAMSANGGTVSLDAGVITYTPPPNFGGVDSFGYTVIDGTPVWGGSATGTVVVTIPTNLELWRVSYGFAADGSGPNEGNSDDYEGDGRDNLLEFAFGFNPLAPDGGGELVISNPGPGGTIDVHGGVTIHQAGGSYFLRYPRRADFASSGLTYVEQFSPNDLAFEDTNESLEVIATGTGAGGVAIEVVEVEFPTSLPVSGRKARFGRVEVTYNP